MIGLAIHTHGSSDIYITYIHGKYNINYFFYNEKT